MPFLADTFQYEDCYVKVLKLVFIYLLLQPGLILLIKIQPKQQRSNRCVHSRSCQGALAPGLLVNEDKVGLFVVAAYTPILDFQDVVLFWLSCLCLLFGFWGGNGCKKVFWSVFFLKICQIFSKVVFNRSWL
jgi:hypothetical protein